MTALDTAQVSGLATPGARWALLYVTATGAAQTGLLWRDLPRPWLVVLAVAATAGAAVLVTVPTDDPMPRAPAAAVAFLPVLAAACLLPQLEPGWPERAWVLAIGCFLGGLLVVRGRPLPAAGGAAVTFALVAAWAGERQAALGDVAAVALVPAAAYVVGAIWRRMLAAHVAALRGHRGGAAQAALEEAATRAAVAASEAELRAIGAEAAPLLDRIAAGEELSASDRVAARLLEARLRARIRARALVREPLVGACDEARRHGTDVLLLDDGSGAHALTDEVLVHIAALVRPVVGGRVTVRVLPPERDALVTVLVEQAGQVRAEALGRDGRTVGRADSPAGVRR